MSSIAYQVLKYIEELGIGTYETDMFLGFMPESPDDCITFYDESAPNISESACLKVDMLGVQVTVRNSSYNTAEYKLNEIHKSLVGFGGQKLVSGGNDISYIIIETAPYSLGKDEKGLNQWTAHYNVRAMSEMDLHRL